MSILAAGGRQEIVAARLTRGSTTPGVYTFGEMHQVLDLIRGKLEMPSEIKLLCGIPNTLGPSELANPFEASDIALIEPAAPHELLLRGFSINRAALFKNISDPIKALGPNIARRAYTWFQKGVLTGNLDVQSECAKDLIKVIPENFAMRELAIEVLRDLRATPADIPSEMAGLCALIPRPIGVITYTFGFMPDGRPIHWPAGFMEDVLEAAHAIGLPVLEPWRLVATCPSSGRMRLFERFRSGGSGSSGLTIKLPAGDAASGDWRWSGA